MPELNVSKQIVPSFSKVDTEEEQTFFRTKLCDLWRLRGSTRFPTCNPKSIGRDELALLRASAYVVSLKSDGVQYTLFLTMRAHDAGPVALLIDRAWTMYEIEVVAPEAFFLQGTVLEGELVWQQPDETRLLYLVFDAVIVKGEYLCHRPFVERIRVAEQCTKLSCNVSALSEDELRDRVLETDSIVITHYSPAIVVRSKTFIDSSYGKSLWDDRTNADHRVDGLIINRADSAYVLGTAHDGSILKWKPKSTVDLETRDGVRCTFEGPLATTLLDRRVEFVETRVAATKESTVLEYLITVTDDAVRLMAVRSRPDKTNANSELIVVATVQNVLDAISPDDLVATSEYDVV